jgi:hypothetical protein
LKKSFKKITIKELSVLIARQLQNHGIDVVLTGGACVTIYSFNQYRSLDLDFVVNTMEDKRKQIKAAMAEIGFSLKPESFFGRADCPYIIEFIPPPLSIGSEQILKTRLVAGVLKMLTPTDCVKDRLAAFFFWNDRQALKQALMVAKRQKINLKEIKRWAQAENQMAKFQEFHTLLKKKNTAKTSY